MIRLETRFRKEYDSVCLKAAFPRLEGCAKPSGDVAQLDRQTEPSIIIPFC